MKTDQFATRDLPTAAFLYASGQKPSGIKSSSEDRHLSFMFDGRKPCEQLVDSLIRKEAMVNAKELLDAMQTFKGLVYSHTK